MSVIFIQYAISIKKKQTQHFKHIFGELMFATCIWC